MVRVGRAVVCCLLLAAAPARAQNSDVFREDAPPAQAKPDHDPFEMAPADPAPAPKLPRRTRLSPETEPVVVTPPPPPPTPAPPPVVHAYDGVYNGTVTTTSSSRGCRAGHTTSITVSQDHFTFPWDGGVNLNATVDNGGKFDISGKGFYGYVRLSGEIQSGDLVGYYVTGGCTYDLTLKK